MASRDRFCWHCGSGLWANDEFCRTCGEDLSKRVPLGQERRVEPEPTSKVEPEATSEVEPEVTQPQIPTSANDMAIRKAIQRIQRLGTDNPNTNYATHFKKGLYTLGVILGWAIIVYGAITGIRSLLLDLDSGLTNRLLYNQVATVIIVGVGILIARFCGKARRRIRHSHMDVSAPVTTRWYSRESISKALTDINYRLDPFFIPMSRIYYRLSQKFEWEDKWTMFGFLVTFTLGYLTLIFAGLASFRSFIIIYGLGLGMVLGIRKLRQYRGSALSAPTSGEAKSDDYLNAPMKCSTCGSDYKVGASFCIGCGSSLSGPTSG